jgi:hypothetical protein
VADFCRLFGQAQHSHVAKQLACTAEQISALWLIVRRDPRLQAAFASGASLNFFAHGLPIDTPPPEAARCIATEAHSIFRRDSAVLRQPDGSSITPAKAEAAGAVVVLLAASRNMGSATGALGMEGEAQRECNGMLPRGRCLTSTVSASAGREGDGYVQVFGVAIFPGHWVATLSVRDWASPAQRRVAVEGTKEWNERVLAREAHFQPIYDDLVKADTGPHLFKPFPTLQAAWAAYQSDLEARHDREGRPEPVAVQAPNTWAGGSLHGLRVLTTGWDATQGKHSGLSQLALQRGVLFVSKQRSGWTGETDLLVFQNHERQHGKVTAALHAKIPVMSFAAFKQLVAREAAPSEGASAPAREIELSQQAPAKRARLAPGTSTSRHTAAQRPPSEIAYEAELPGACQNTSCGPVCGNHLQAGPFRLPAPAAAAPAPAVAPSSAWTQRRTAPPVTHATFDGWSDDDA